MTKHTLLIFAFNICCQQLKVLLAKMNVDKKSFIPTAFNFKCRILISFKPWSVYDMRVHAVTSVFWTLHMCVQVYVCSRSWGRWEGEGMWEGDKDNILPIDFILNVASWAHVSKKRKKEKIIFMFCKIINNNDLCDLIWYTYLSRYLTLMTALGIYYTIEDLSSVITGIQ